MTIITQEPALPVGAKASAWDVDNPIQSDSSRSLRWSTHDVPGAGVGVHGIQDGDGTVAWFIALSPHAGNELAAAQACALAAALLEAADALDRL